MLNKKIIKWLIEYIRWGLEKRKINDTISANKVLIQLENELRKYDNEIRKALKPLGYLGLYMCYRVTLKRKKDKEKIRAIF